MRQLRGYFLVLTLLMTPAAFAVPPTVYTSLVGTWTNTNAATKSIVKIVITQSGSTLVIHPYGACSPTPCDHGAFAAASFSDGVASRIATGFRGVKNFGFKTTGYNGKLASQRLYLLTQDTFASGDTRFNYNVLETFTKTALTDEAALTTPTQTPADHSVESDLY